MITEYNNFNNTGTTPVVQGHPIKGQFVSASLYGHSAGYPDIQTKGEHQPKRFNDAFWGILFFSHVIALAYFAMVYLPQIQIDFDEYNFNNNNYYANNVDDENNENNGDDGDDKAYYGNLDDYYNRFLGESENETGLVAQFVGVFTRMLSQANSSSHRGLGYEGYGSNPHGILSLIGLTIVSSFFLSILCLTVMIHFAEGLIKISLFFNMAIGIVVSIVGFSTDKLEVGFVGLILFALAACYSWAVWSRIPFAATNLVTASTAVQANLGLTIFAYCAIIVNGIWLIFWSASTYSTLYVIGGCNANGECQNDINPAYFFLFILSLYWTMQVIKNVVHVTVAGTIGTWWWTPLEASGCCSKGVRDSNNRALTYSFGSICFGSLFVAIIQTLKQFAEAAREADDSIFRCMADCILSCLETIMEMFNEWAFCYVGLYGYSFIEAAKNVFTLFQSRGWTAIITDYVVDRVLMMLVFGNGLLSGSCAALISYSFSFNLDAEAFTIGFFIGILLTSTVLGLVASGVNTVIVCYAEDPAIFEVNHYELSLRMRDTWRMAFPEQFAY